MGISRDTKHKRRHTGGKRKIHMKKRKYNMGRQPANTKLGDKRVHVVRGRGGNLKFRALRLESGNFSWGTEVCTRKTRILDVVYNASNNELVRTKTLVKNAIVQVDATPFKQWYETHYGVEINKSQGSRAAVSAASLEGKGEAAKKKLAARQAQRELDTPVAEALAQGRLLAAISSRPGQCGRADGYILEGKELEFYLKKINAKKNKKA
uniref:40S ribosomal protein S8 n=1 Tax=Placidida sp. TaxID=2810146 RepID=A0A8E8PJD3_9STRA|nr:40S ribosomal protein S8 [Placidida sp.]QWE91157.1 40S ribosomal protein S8 [Placidida sp.]QWE91158.1 40S ribosomal protein S8 [Placidida sp.]QWE91159.1 40S ribosomal protein S8 [Placidida sp.]